MTFVLNSTPSDHDAVTLCGDEPPIIHADEQLDLEIYQPTIVDEDEVAA
jgi:hypothetical protein